MKKNVYIVWNDFYHPREVLEPLVERIFPSARFCVTASHGYGDFAKVKPDLLVQFTIGDPPPAMEEPLKSSDLISKMVPV